MFHPLSMCIARPYRPSVALEEEKAWVDLYRRVDDPSIAATVIQHLDAEPDLRRAHPALYLRCKESVRQRKAREARTKRLSRFMRMLLRGLHVCLKLTRRPLQHRPGIVIGGRPESTAESLRPPLKSLSKTAELAATPPDGAGQTNASRPARHVLTRVSRYPATPQQLECCFATSRR